MPVGMPCVNVTVMGSLRVCSHIVCLRRDCMNSPHARHTWIVSGAMPCAANTRSTALRRSGTFNPWTSIRQRVSRLGQARMMPPSTGINRIDSIHLRNTSKKARVPQGKSVGTPLTIGIPWSTDDCLVMVGGASSSRGGVVTGSAFTSSSLRSATSSSGALTSVVSCNHGSEQCRRGTSKGWRSTRQNRRP